MIYDDVMVFNHAGNSVNECIAIEITMEYLNNTFRISGHVQ